MSLFSTAARVAPLGFIGDQPPEKIHAPTKLGTTSTVVKIALDRYTQHYDGLQDGSAALRAGAVAKVTGIIPTSDANTRQARNFGYTFAAPSYYTRWTHGRAARRLEAATMPPKPVHIIPNLDGLMSKFQAQCAGVVAEAVVNNPLTHTAQGDRTRFSAAFYAHQIDWVRKLYGTILDAVRIISKSSYIAEDTRLAVYMGSSIFSDLSMQLDADETVVADYKIGSPVVPLCFEFLQSELGPENLGFGILSMRDPGRLNRSLIDPGVPDTLYELAPLLEEESVYSLPLLPPDLLGAMMSGDAQPFSLEALSGCTPAEADSFWKMNGTFDRYSRALSEFELLTQRLIFDSVNWAARRNAERALSASTPDNVGDVLRENPDIAKLLKAARELRVSKVDILASDAQAGYTLKKPYLETSDDYFEQLLIRMDDMLKFLLRTKNSNRDGVLFRLMIQASPAIQSWLKKNAGLLDFAQKMLPRYQEAKSQMVARYQHVNEQLEGCYYEDEDGNKMPLGLSIETDVMRFLIANRIANPDKLTLVLNNTPHEAVRIAFDHLFYRRDVKDASGRPVDPHVLFGVPTKMRDKVFVIMLPDYSRLAIMQTIEQMWSGEDREAS